jgi:4-amino-4-deoxy-L-arabinose transferase-like glycosyltransferase
MTTQLIHDESSASTEIPWEATGASHRPDPLSGSRRLRPFSLRRIARVEGADDGTPAWWRRLTGNRFLLVLLVLFSVSTLIWDWQYRRGQPYDIDESGYLTFSLLDFHALGEGGLVGWLRQVLAPNIHAPLTTALTTPVYLVFGPRLVAALIVPLAFTLIAIAATYGIARRVSDGSVARGAAILMASAPVVINYSRDYHFAASATAVTATALYCLARSDGLMHRGWAAGFGMAVGLMPLTRTMTVALIPGIAVAVAVTVIANAERGRRLVNAALSTVAAVTVSSLWLGVNGNGQQVWAYLTGFGYGTASAAYGTSHPLWSYRAWLGSLQTLAAYTYLPHLLLFVVGAIAFVALVIRGLLSGGDSRRATLAREIRRAAQSRLMPLVSITALGWVALTSSANQGSAFSAPLVPAMCILAVWALRSVVRRPRWCVSIAIGVVAVVAAVPSLPISWPLARTVDVTVPGLGGVPLASGRGVIHHYIEGGTGLLDGHLQPGATETGRRWMRENQQTADRLAGQYGNRALVAFGFRHRLLNPNTVNLVQVAAGNAQIPLVMVPRESLDDSVDAYRAWLRTGTGATSCLLLTASGTISEIVPLVANDKMSSAAVAEGFEPTREWLLPDGRLATEWKRAEFCPA